MFIADAIQPRPEDPQTREDRRRCREKADDLLRRTPHFLLFCKDEKGGEPVTEGTAHEGGTLSFNMVRAIPPRTPSEEATLQETRRVLHVDTILYLEESHNLEDGGVEDNARENMSHAHDQWVEALAIATKLGKGK